MTTAFSRIKTHFANWREWELNPVVVKELRQAVRSRMLTGTLLLLITALFLATLVLFAGRGYLVVESQQLGRPVFRVFMIILTFASFIFVPLFTGIRLAAERQESDVDLMFATPLSPHRIIRGKFLCGAYLTVLLFSACMPFMAFTNLLRGVDLPTIAFILVCLYSAVCLAVQAAIFVACLRFQQLLKIFLGIMFAVGLMAACGVLIILLDGALDSGAGAIFGKASSRLGFFAAIVLIAVAIQWLHLVSVALIMADSRPRGYFNEVIREGAQ